MTTRQKWSVPIKWESNRLNNFAISSGGVGDALLNSASALAAAGNSLDESIAMITAANTVVQDPQKVGTSMKTISMYLRAAKTDAEAAGESTDGMADSVSKLRAEILQLTGGKVDIQIDENNFKSTYQIMKDLSEVWSSLSDISQANILERIGGKRNANITAALLENFELVDKVIDKTSDSTGSALAENEKYLNSVNGKIAQFKASFEELSTTTLDSDILKLVIDAGSLGIETINAVVNGLKGVAGALTGLGVGLEYIIPLLGLKFFGVFDGIADYATDKLLDIGVVLEKLYNDSGKSIGGIFKKAGSGIKDFLKSGFGKASIAIATISLLVTAFNNLTERTEKAKAKLEETRTELSDTQSKLESLNKELTDTRIRMGELLSMESLTYVEYDELNKLKLSNKELEKEVELLEAKEKLLKKQEVFDFNKTAKNELNSFWESFEGLSFWDFLSGNINYGDTQEDQVKRQIDDYFHNLKVYGYRQNDYLNLSSKYSGKKSEQDQKEYQKEADRLEKDMSDIDESIQNSKAYLEERLLSYQSAISGMEYGINETTDKYLDKYNDLIDSISIALGYDDAKENAFISRINKRVSSEKISSKAEEVVSVYEDVLSQIDEKGITLSKNVFGNIDLNNRKVLEWNEENIETYSDALKSWGFKPDNIKDKISTVMGSSGTYDGIEIAFSPLLQTEKGAVLLNSNTVDKYIFGLIDNAKKDGKFDTEELFNLDASGLTIDGIEIKNLLADIGNTAVETAENMHYIGEQGEFKLAYNGLIDELGKGGAISVLTELGKSGNVTLDILKDICDFSDDTTNELEDFIDELVDVGYISDKTDDNLRKVARAFNALGQDVDNSSDVVEDAFKRWENAQYAVESGAKFDSFKEAMELVYDTVSDKSSELYAKVGNENYKAAIELIVPEWKNIDSSDMSAVKKYQKEIKKFFTFDENGEYKGLNVKAFSQKALEAELVDYDKVTKTYKIKGKQTLESFAQGMGLSIPAIKAIIGEINEYGGDIQLYEYNKDIVSLAKEAKNAAASLEESFGDLDIELDLTTIEDPITYIDQKIAELDKKRIEPNVDTTSFNNYTKIMEYYIRQKQLLEKPAILMLDTTQIEDPSSLAAINKLIKFTNIKREIEVQATLGHDTSTLEKDLAKLAEDIQKSYKDGGGIAALDFEFDEKSKKSLTEQINDFINGLTKDDLIEFKIGITEESFQPAMDAIETMATKIDEIFNGERVLTFNWEKEDGVWKLKINTEDVDDANKKTEQTSENIDEITDDKKINIKPTSTTEKTYKSVSELLGNLVGATLKDWIVKVKLKYSGDDESGDGGISEVTGTANGVVKPGLTGAPIQNFKDNRLNEYLGGNLWGKHGVNGTAHANGNWGFEGGEALVGELGQEIVVDPKTSSWYTVGDHGAEFANIPKDAIIFNHKQTESLLKNGYVTGRGHALVGGTALNLTGSWGDVPTGDVNDQGKKSKDSSQIIDYIEILLSRLSRSLENFAKVADDTSKSFKERNKALEKQIDKTNSLITTNQSAADAYLKKANSISLSSSIKEKVRNGSYNITEYDSNTAEKINQYKEYYEKYLSAIDEVTAQKLSRAELQMERYALIQQKYDSKFELQDSKIGYYENLDEQAELDGKSGSIKAQNSLINIQERRKKLLEEERDELEALFNSGTIKKGTEDWYSMQTAIQDVKADIIATDNEISNLENRKIEIQYERFENIAEGHDNEIALRDNRISLQEANNTKAELEGKGGSITAQNKIISLHKERTDILNQERIELRKQLKNIKEGTPEWYDAKQKIQDINVDLVETENAILEANKTINEIRLERFNSVSDDYAGKHSKTDARIAYYEDLNTKYELLGNNGSVYAQDKMMEWNAEYINNLKAEEEDLRAKLKDINKDTPEYQQALDTLRNHLDKIRDAENQQIEYQNNKRDILLAGFNDIQTQYDNKLGDINNELSRVDHDIAMTEAKGYRLTEEHYRRQIEIETKRLDTINEKYAEMKASFENAVNVGNIKEGSLEWYEYKNALDEVEQSAYDTELTITNLNESIKDLEWENFKYLREEISELNDEADFYLDLLSNKDMFDDFGNITEYGTTALGLHGQKYNTYISEASAYSDKLAEIESKLASDPSNQTLIDQKRELKDAIYDNILAAEDEKKAMIDLVEDGINYELDALRKLIDEYETALDKAKDLHDYEKDVADSTSEISSIKKQLSAYAGDDSQESIAKIQKLREDLKKAEEDLEETEYDKYISDQKELLDEFYNEYEENLNARLEDVDSLIIELTGSVNSNASLINSTLSSLASDFGIVMSEEMTAIWGNDTFGKIMNDYMGNESGIFKGQTSIISVLEMISDKVTNILNNSNDNDSVNTGAFGGSFGDSVSGSNSSKYNIGDELLLSNAVGYNSVGDTNPAAKNLSSYLGKNSYGDELLFPYSVIATDGDWIGIAPSDAYENPLYWIKASDGNIKKFKKGGIVDYTGLAWVDGTKSKPEYMLNAEDTANLMRLTDDLRKLYNIRSNGDSLTKEASDMIRSSGLGSDVLSDINKSVSSATNTIGDINITIPIERVQDYNDFVTQLRDDPKFNKFIKSVSIDLLDGKSRLAKNKINWNK